MAAFKFFNIGKANEEITRLEAELTKAQAETKTATENAEAIAGPAQEAANKLTQAEADLATAKQTISTLTTRAEAAEKSLKEANEKLANPGQQITVAASRKALEITAAQGQAPATSSTTTGTSNDVLAEYEAIKDPVARTEWYRKNKSAYNAAFRAQNPGELKLGKPPQK